MEIGHGNSTGGKQSREQTQESQDPLIPLGMLVPSTVPVATTAVKIDKWKLSGGSKWPFSKGLQSQFQGKQNKTKQRTAELFTLSSLSSHIPVPCLPGSALCTPNSPCPLWLNRKLPPLHPLHLSCPLDSEVLISRLLTKERRLQSCSQPRSMLLNGTFWNHLWKQVMRISGWRCVIQLVECLPHMNTALNSIPSAA